MTNFNDPNMEERVLFSSLHNPHKQGTLLWLETPVQIDRIKDERSTLSTGVYPTQRTMFVDEDKLVISTTGYIRFRAKGMHHGTWVRKTKIHRTTLSFRHGQFNAYFIYPKGRKKVIQNVTMGDGWLRDLDKDPMARNAFIAMANRYGYDITVNDLLFPRLAQEKLAAPVLRDLPKVDFLKPFGTSPWRKARDLRSLVTGIYGTYTKAHLRHLRTNMEEGRYPYHIIMATLKGLIPHEWLDDVKISGEWIYVCSDVYKWANVPMVRRFLRHFTEHKRLDFINTMDSRRADIIRMLIEMDKQGAALPELPRRQFTWTEVHDLLAVHMRTLAHTSEVIPQTDLAQAIDGQVFGHLTLRTAKVTKEMVSWGAQMNHCIGSYTNTAVSGDGIYFGLYKPDGTLHANGEIRRETTYSYFDDNDEWVEPKRVVEKPHALTQLLGKYNASVPEANEVIMHLGLGFGITAKNVWGAGRHGFEPYIPIERGVIEETYNPYHVGMRGLHEDPFNPIGLARPILGPGEYDVDEPF